MKKLNLLGLFLCLGAGTAWLAAQQDASPHPEMRGGPTHAPHLEKRGAVTQLIVDGKPFLMLSGELHNSSSSNLEYMKPFWPKLAAMGLNTVVTPLSWELIEPEEGNYDFRLSTGLSARRGMGTSDRVSVAGLVEERNVELCAGVGEAGYAAIPARGGARQRGGDSEPAVRGY